MKWEYKVENINGFCRLRKEEVLLIMGNEGWELVSVDNDTAYFKRPAKSELEEFKEVFAKKPIEGYFGGKVG